MMQKKEMRRPGHAGAGVRFRKIRSYTLIQLSFVVCVFALAKLPFVAVTFPLLIAILIPFRIYVLPRFYSEEELMNLDPPDPAPEDNALQSDSARSATSSKPDVIGEELQRTATGIVMTGISDSDCSDATPAHDTSDLSAAMSNSSQPPRPSIEAV